MMKDKEFGVNIKFDLFTTTSNFDSNEANNPCLFFVKDKNSSEYKRDNNLTNLLRSNEEFMKRVKDKLIRETLKLTENDRVVTFSTMTKKGKDEIYEILNGYLS